MISQSELTHACSILAQGGLVAIPTETVYGLAADAENESAVAQIYKAKGRPSSHPLIVHVASAEAIGAWTRSEHLKEDIRKLTEAFWPGPLTLVLPKSSKAGDFVTGGQNTVALRCPSHPVAHALLKMFDAGLFRGIAAPSANTFGKISPTSAQHVLDDLGVKPEGRADLILDGGPCEVGVESTILDLTASPFRILREGAITGRMISEVLQKEVIHGAIGSSPRVSGSLKSHYAPEHPVEMVAAEDLAGRAQFLARKFKTFALIAPDSPVKRFSKLAVSSRSYQSVQELQTHLYGWLHELDRSGCDTILVVPPAYSEEAAAVLDRLARASADRGR